MPVEQLFLIETDHAGNEPPAGCIRTGLNRSEHSAKILRKFPRPERQLRHHAEAAPAPAFETPEQFRIHAGVGSANRPVRRHHLRFQQRRRGRSIILRETAEAAALDQSRDADRRASSALNVATSFCGHCIVGLFPNRARPNGDGWLRFLYPHATLRDERVV